MRVLVKHQGKTGFRRGDISAVCNLRQKTAKGFIWSFKKL